MINQSSLKSSRAKAERLDKLAHRSFFLSCLNLTAAIGWLSLQNIFWGLFFFAFGFVFIVAGIFLYSTAHYFLAKAINENVTNKN